MLAAVLSGFVVALLAPAVTRLAGRFGGRMLALLPAALTVYFLAYLPRVTTGQAVVTSRSWVPALGTQLSFYLDALSLPFVLVVTAIGSVVMVYSDGYLPAHPQLGRFYALLTAFMATMLGLVLSGNLITLVVFWELTSLASYFLIGFDHANERARAAALQALIVTGIGGLALLLGVLLLGRVTGTLELSQLSQRSGALRSDPHYHAIVALLFLGTFTKSAQVPFHFWLPSAMVAPTPVSAYLHSATMVKAGVYLLARLSPILGGTLFWTSILTVVGALTFLTGAWIAFHARDLKHLFAQSTVSVLGALTLLLGLGTPRAATAAITYLLAHALYKSALFLVSGAIEHATGVRDVNSLGGLRNAMPVTTIAALLSALSMTGLPPLLGFHAKEALYDAVRHSGSWALVLTSITVLSAALSFAAALVAIVGPFFGPPTATPRRPHEVQLSMWSGPILLGITSLLLGLFPTFADRMLIAPAAASILGQPLQHEPAPSHGPDTTFLLSVLSMGFGWFLYSARTIVTAALSKWSRHFPRATDGFGLFLAALKRLAEFQTKYIQSGILRHYVLVILGTLLAAAGFVFADRAGWPPGTFRWPRVGLVEWVTAAMILGAALTATLSPSRLGAVAALGFVGYGVALVYIEFGAPDLAMTQFLIETLSVVLFVMVFRQLPTFAYFSSPASRVRDLIMALAFGTAMALLVLAATAIPPSRVLTDYFAHNSVTRAHGRNIVNVILVDFRALDTLGEITVLSASALGVYALLRLRTTGRRAP